MNDAKGYRRKARHFLMLARQFTRPEDRATRIVMASFWFERVEEADRDKRIVQQQQQTQPKKGPECDVPDTATGAKRQEFAMHSEWRAARLCCLVGEPDQKTKPPTQASPAVSNIAASSASCAPAASQATN
jgi:hypothetical protein